MRFDREFRLLPVVLLATICLLGLKILGTVSQVKDECKERKIGRCAGQ